MLDQSELSRLREVITESLRVQKGGESIEYIDVGNALSDACARQNHAIFARRGCGKTLLLHHSAKHLRETLVAVYLNCEDFKSHSFPNVLIEILKSLFREIERNLPGWFGKKRKSRALVRSIIEKLDVLQASADEQDEQIRKLYSRESSSDASLSSGTELEGINLKAGFSKGTKGKEEIEKTFRIYRQKLQELDRWLPELKEQIREFFTLSNSIKGMVILIDDLYHLRRTDQAFVMDYIHRLCKDLPLYFKVATMRHVSTLYADRDGQPIGAQERHDYQPIEIDYTFSEFARTSDQNWRILEKFAEKAGLGAEAINDLFKGEGFSRLVMAGGGVPRDVLSLFLEVLSRIDSKAGEKIGKDDVRILSRAVFERRIEELKQDSKGEEQDDLLRGIYIIRTFCLDKQTNLFLVREKDLQQKDDWRALFYRLMDYRIIHNCANALTQISRRYVPSLRYRHRVLCALKKTARSLQ